MMSGFGCITVPVLVVLVLCSLNFHLCHCKTTAVECVKNPGNPRKFSWLSAGVLLFFLLKVSVLTRTTGVNSGQAGAA
jgi:hypothetical protein